MHAASCARIVQDLDASEIQGRFIGAAKIFSYHVLDQILQALGYLIPGADFSILVNPFWE